MPLEPELFVKHVFFIIPKDNSYYPENLRSEAYGLNESQTLIGSDRPLEPQIFVRHMVFTIPNGHSYYPGIFRSEAYGLNKSHFLVF